jgi:phenylpropionate dioxygenase-like ring-hydroxylating dioxygenase large terminal subunit
MTVTDPASAEAAVSPLALPGSRYPTGWFMVAWSDEIGPGEVKLVEYFGEEIVLWRGESQRLYATDAYCLHLGANLGVRGTVEGEEIVCPWHSWHWAGDGSNTLIPYSEQRCKKNLKLRTWPVHEASGWVLVWHDLAGGPPTWDPPEFAEFDDDRYYPITDDTRHRWRIKAHPQMVMENGVDAAHIPNIHGAGVVPTIEDVDYEGHRWCTRVRASYGAGKDSTWLTPEGEIQVQMEFRLWGVGLGAAYWPPELTGAVMPTFVTPIDDTHSDLWWHMTALRVPGSGDEMPKQLRRFMEHQRDTITEDFFTWEHMKVLHTPNFAPEEAQYYAAMRRWAWQFYPGARQPGQNGAPGDGA